MDPLKPVNTLIDKTEDLLGHSPHPMIVTLPLGAWAVSNLSDMVGAATGCRAYDDAARISMGIGLAGAAGSVVTGIRDYSFIPDDRPSHDVATTHALGNAVVGSLFAASFILRVQDHQAGRRPSVLARALALAGGGLMLYTAWLGGKLVEEYGEAVKPVMDEQAGHESDREHGRDRLNPASPLGGHRG